MSVVGIVAPSVLPCPNCGAASEEIMPTDACLIRFDCGCGATLRPKPGDCCIFCFYGSVSCPPIQLSRETGHDSCCGCAGTPRRQIHGWSLMFDPFASARV